jgi:hypothetical protein
MLADASARRDQRSERLIEYIRANILKVMRDIWSHEDAEQRQRRYAQIFVPTKFTFVPDPNAQIAPGDLAPGTFEPVYDPDSMRRLTDLIHPSGPLAYCANYAVFLLREDATLVDLNQALSVLRSAYARFAVDVTTQAAQAPIASWIASPRHTSVIYTLTVGSSPTNWQAQAALPDGTPPWSTPVKFDQATGIAQFDGCCVQFASPPAAGTTYRVAVAATDELEDPELRALRLERPLPLANNETAVLSAVLSDQSCLRSAARH